MILSDVFPKLSGVNEIDSLVDTSHPLYTYITPSKGNTITYSFDSYATWSGLPGTVNSVPDSQKDNIRNAVQYIGQVTGINFTEISGKDNTPQIFFGYSPDVPSQNSAYTYWHYYYNTDMFGGISSFREYSDIFFSSTDTKDTSDLSPGKYGYQLILHEMGHVLGLKHPFEGSITLPDNVNSTDYTLMSYNNTVSTATTYSPFDFEALGWLYGNQGLTGQNQYNLTYALSLSTVHGSKSGSAAQSQLRTADATEQTVLAATTLGDTFIPGLQNQGFWFAQS